MARLQHRDQATNKTTSQAHGNDKGRDFCQECVSGRHVSFYRISS